MADQQPSPLRRYPKYGDNHIEEKVVFDTDKHSSTFGRPYYYSKKHEVKDRNKFLYKLTNDLHDDSFDCASGSQSVYSALSYRSNFEDYYYPMPPTFQEVNAGDDVVQPKEKPPHNYGFRTYNPPFEQRSRNIRLCAEALRVTNNKLLPGERKKSQSEKLAANNQIRHGQHQHQRQSQQESKHQQRHQPEPYQKEKQPAQLYPQQQQQQEQVAQSHHAPQKHVTMNPPQKQHHISEHTMAGIEEYGEDLDDFNYVLKKPKPKP